MIEKQAQILPFTCHMWLMSCVLTVDTWTGGWELRASWTLLTLSCPQSMASWGGEGTSVPPPPPPSVWSATRADTSTRVCRLWKVMTWPEKLNEWEMKLEFQVGLASLYSIVVMSYSDIILAVNLFTSRQVIKFDKFGLFWCAVSHDKIQNWKLLKICSRWSKQNLDSDTFII